MSNVLTKKDLRRCLNRYIFTRQSPFNYETMQSGGWVYSIHPAMEKIYDGDADLLAEKYKDHFKFYNTHPWMGNIILGACIAIESTKDPDATKQAVEMRTALMGPLAGIGDAIIWIMFMTILGAIAAYMALEGSIVGWVIAKPFSWSSGLPSTSCSSSPMNKALPSSPPAARSCSTSRKRRLYSACPLSARWSPRPSTSNSVLR